MSLDLNAMSYTELQSLYETIGVEIGKRAKQEKAKALNQIREIAKNYGIDLGELSAGGVRQSTPVTPKYRNPEDASQTWTGRGRKPIWVQAALDAGKTLEDLAI